MDARLLASELLGKCDVFWSQLSAEIEVFLLHLVTTIYQEGEGTAYKVECWTVVLTMVRLKWRELRKFRVEAETEYGSDDPIKMVGQCILGNLQAHRVMDDFLLTQFRQHPEVAPRITLYLFEHRDPLVEVPALKQRVESQAKTLTQLENTCK